MGSSSMLCEYHVSPFPAIIPGFTYHQSLPCLLCTYPLHSSGELVKWHSVVELKQFCWQALAVSLAQMIQLHPEWVEGSLRELVHQ